ncbi:hypothetical protein [Endozoicomonas euniceicola]|uniref:Uncharacterized protein n=1 Tax=Endozoicomonas euniceicola TaxID=1234143 RepID=A0ABY6GYA7_9GAMM|nr:hypothetical protein [Endozoicomonas euniceicola]UYM17783.1 hypothetical protein NX720_07700 [Endozoicomonas euniceicola]
MKSFFSKILMLTLLAFTASVSVAHEDNPSGCWFDNSNDQKEIYENTSYLNSYCAVSFSQSNDYRDNYIGKVIQEGEALECNYTDTTGIVRYNPTARWLNTNYETLYKIIRTTGGDGVFAESITQFNNRFAECPKTAGMHSPTVDKSSTNFDTGLNQPQSQWSICMFKTNLASGKDKDKVAIIIGYWQADTKQCNTHRGSPYYLKEQNKQNEQNEQNEQLKDGDGCLIYNPDTEFSCDGYDFYRRGWAEECLSAFGGKMCYESTNCKKDRTKEECCEFAHDENCETVSMDRKGHCCCGVRLNKDNDGCRNVGLRKK